jgi:hypothetical protein
MDTKSEITILEHDFLYDVIARWADAENVTKHTQMLCSAVPASLQHTTTR